MQLKLSPTYQLFWKISFQESDDIPIVRVKRPQSGPGGVDNVGLHFQHSDQAVISKIKGPGGHYSPRLKSRATAEHSGISGHIGGRQYIGSYLDTTTVACGRYAENWRVLRRESFCYPEGWRG